MSEWHLHRILTSCAKSNRIVFILRRLTWDCSSAHTQSAKRCLPTSIKYSTICGLTQAKSHLCARMGVAEALARLETETNMICIFIGRKSASNVKNATNSSNINITSRHIWSNTTKNEMTKTLRKNMDNLYEKSINFQVHLFLHKNTFATYKFYKNQT